jgi:hypothetical protein
VVLLVRRGENDGSRSGSRVMDLGDDTMGCCRCDQLFLVLLARLWTSPERVSSPLQAATGKEQDDE